MTAGEDDRVPVAALAFGLGAAVSSASLGFVPAFMEIDGALRFDVIDVLVLGGAALVVAAVQAWLWVTGMTVALGLHRWTALVVLGAAAVGEGVLTLAILGFATQETRHPSLVPVWGSRLCAGSNLLLVLSFAAVLGAPARGREARAWAWLVMIAAIAVAAAPYLVLRAACALVLAFAVSSAARAGVRAASFANAATAITLAAGLALAVLRNVEHRRLAEPGILGVYATAGAQHCRVQPAADFRVEGGSLWAVECSPGQRRLVGWDETHGSLIEDDDLAARRRPLP